MASPIKGYEYKLHLLLLLYYVPYEYKLHLLLLLYYVKYRNLVKLSLT